MKIEEVNNDLINVYFEDKKEYKLFMEELDELSKEKGFDIDSEWIGEGHFTLKSVPRNCLKISNKRRLTWFENFKRKF